MNILMVAAEAAPFQQTGDVARVVSGLCVELKRQGHDVRLVMPRYRNIALHAGLSKVVDQLDVRLGSHTTQANVSRTDFPSESVSFPVYFVENTFYFGRELPYGYLDDYERFIFFSRAVTTLLDHADPLIEGWMPDVVHGHDWTAGMLPVFLRQMQQTRPDVTCIASVYTVHNAAFEGIYSSRALRLAEIEPPVIYPDLRETSDRINFMARGVLTADVVNTVSPHYADDIRQGREAQNLHSALKLHGTEISGILNGIDNAAFDPAFDGALPQRFNQHSLDRRKQNKAELQRALGLVTNIDSAVLAFVSRLMPDKGAGLLQQIVPDLLTDGCQIVVAGAAGDPHYRRVFTDLATSHPTQVAAPMVVNDELSRKIYAAADIVMIPSLLEPCGLQQMLAMRYGAVPVVHETGGLADTISPWGDNSPHGRGFTFKDSNALSFLATMKDALRLFRSIPGTWRDIQQHNMAVDHSWKQSAQEYVNLYQRAIEASRHRDPLPVGNAMEEEPRGPLVNAILEIAELASSAELGDFVSQVAQNMRELLQGDAVLIWLRDETDQQIMYLAEDVREDGNIMSRQTSDHPLQVAYMQPDSRAWHHYYQRQSPEFDPYAQMGYLGSELAQEQGWNVQVTAPIYTPGTMLGRADVFFKDASHPHVGREVDVLGALARTLADNLQKKRSVQQQEQLLAAYHELVHARSLTDAAEIVVRQAKHLTHSTEASILLATGYRGHLGEYKAFAESPLTINEDIPSSVRPDEAAGSGTMAEPSQRLRQQHGEIRFPIRAANGEAVGVIGVARDSARIFNQDDEAILQRLISHAADVLQAAKAREKRDETRVTELKRLSASLVEGGDFQHLLDRVVKTTAEVLQAQGASLYLLNEQNRLEIRAAAGYHEQILEHHNIAHDVTYEIGEGLTGWIAQHKETLKADSSGELHDGHWKGKFKHLQNNREPNAFLGIPLLIIDRNTQKERAIGVLKFEDRNANATPVFTSEDVLLVTMMANLIAAVVYNTGESENRLQRLSGDLGKLSRALAGGTGVSELVNTVVKTTAEVLGAEASSLYLLAEDKTNLKIQAATGYQEKLVKEGVTYLLGEGITGWIASKRKVVRANSLNDLRNHQAWLGKQNPFQAGREPNSFLGLPLIVAGRSSGEDHVIGVLKAENIVPSKDHPEDHFTDQDVLLVTMMANVIAAVVYNTQESDSRLQRLSGDLGKLSRALAGGTGVSELVNTVVKTTAEVLGAEASSLYLLGEDNVTLKIQAATGYQEELVEKGVTYLLGEGITGWIASKREVVRANSLNELRNHRAWLGKQNPLQAGREPNSFLGLPLIVAGRVSGEEHVIGVLKVENIVPSNDHPEDHFTDQDVLLVTMMANVIATVVNNAQVSGAQLRRLSNDLKKLSRVLAGGKSVQDLVNSVVKTTADVLGAEASSLYLLDEATDELVVQAATGYQENLVRSGATYLLGEGITGWIASKKEVVRANSLTELRKHVAWRGKQNDNQGGREPESFLGLPLIVAGSASGADQVIGVLKVENIVPTKDHPERYFTDQDVLLVTMMANVIATVVNNISQGDERIGAILRELGTPAAPQMTAEQLLSEFAQNRDRGIIDQLAIGIVASFDRVALANRETHALAEIGALVAAQCNPDLFGRIAKRAQDPQIRWLFSLFQTILTTNPARDSVSINAAAEPWIRLRGSTEPLNKFEAALERVTSALSDSLRTPIVDRKSDAIWCAHTVDTSNAFPESIRRIALLFQRQGDLNELNRDWLMKFAESLPKPYPVLLLVLWNSELKPDDVRSLRQTLRGRALDIAVARIGDIIKVLESISPMETLRALVLRQIAITSPYQIFGSVTDSMFFGRAREIRTIVEHVSKKEGLRSYIVLGGRRIGKTSTLQRLARIDLPAAGFRTIYVSCEEFPTRGEFLSAPYRWWGGEPLPNAPESIGALLETVTDDDRIVLLIDEVDLLIGDDSKSGWELFKRLRAYMGSGRLRLVLCGERALMVALEDSSMSTGPLFNFANQLSLGPLDVSDVEELIVRPMRLLDIELVSRGAIVRRIYELTSGHPNIVQRLCNRLIGRLNERSLRQITLNDVEAVQSEPEFQKRDFLDTYWVRATPLERIVSLLMAVKGDKTFTLREVVNLLSSYNVEVRQDAVEAALNSLVRLRSILREGKGGWSFAVKAFPLYVGSSPIDDRLRSLKSDLRDEENKLQ